MSSWFGGWGAQSAAPAGNTSGPAAPVGTALLLGTQSRLPVPAATLPLSSAATAGGGTDGGGTYKEGDLVEYFSASLSKWIPAKVTAVNKNGTYSLDCKPDVTVDKIRRPGSVANSGSGTTSATAGLPSSANGAIGEYQVGEYVEYYGASQGKWIPAKILSRSDTGKYNLDCKPDVTADRIRRPAAAPGAGTAYKAGDRVEYFSASAGAWIAAQVVKANPAGTYDLDCKPDVSVDKIRLPASAAASGASAAGANKATAGAFREGEDVEYFGATQGKWIPTKVRKVNASGTYDLDCKPDVLPEKIRKPSAGTAAVNQGVGSRALSGFSVGDKVDYFSATQGTWIPAVVTAVKSSGTYDLDCKPEVAAERIRVRSVGSAPGAAPYAVGENVEYFGATEGRWISAKVLAVNANGTFDLNVKPQVPVDKIRRPGSTGADVPGTTMSGLAGQAFGAMATFFGSANPPQQTLLPQTQLGGLPGASVSSATADAPVQLLRVQRQAGRWRFEVCPEGTRYLEQHGSRKVAVASVCGLYRTGKSFLLNLLSERLQRGLPPFQVGGTTRACTEGLWLWGAPDGSDDQATPLVALLDCEGFGNTESDSTRDAQLMTLCALLSSVLILNTRGALNEGLFGALSLTCRFAEHIEERGNEASRPTLLWVLRDFMLDMVDSQGRPTTPDDYLEQALHAAPGRDASSGQAGREARQSLLRFFSRRYCTTLPRPAEEESQLQRLDQMGYTALRRDFRTGVEALRSRVITDCQGAPKAVGGQPLSCIAFVALLRQLVAALNDSKVLSVRGAWETVQHTSCGQLADELRASAQQTLHALAGGQKLVGSGAQLPMTDEMLRQVLREQRHLLKAKWDERAVGDELVREEYWQELKESLAREEALVRQKNTRLADQQLMEALKVWQEWLNDDNSAPTAVEGICRELGQLMEKMPAGPLARAGKAAIDASCRRVAAVRQVVVASSEKHGELHRKTVEWSEQAAHQEGAARNQLTAKMTELQLTKEALNDKTDAHAELQTNLNGMGKELEDLRNQTQKAMTEAEAARIEEHDLRARQRVGCDTESALQADLERVRAATAKANADRLAAERLARSAADNVAADRRALEVELDQTRGEVERVARQLASEREHLRGEHLRTREEHAQKAEDVRRQLAEERQTLQSEKEKTKSEHMRMLEDCRTQLEDERNKHKSALDDEKDKHMERERRAGVLEGQVQALTAETTNLRERLKELEEKAHVMDLVPAKHVEENAALQIELTKARETADKAKRDSDEKLRKLADEHQRLRREEETKLAEKQNKRGIRKMLSR